MFCEVQLGEIEGDQEEAADVLHVEGNILVGESEGDTVDADKVLVGETEGEVKLPRTL